MRFHVPALILVLVVPVAAGCGTDAVRPPPAADSAAESRRDAGWGSAPAVSGVALRRAGDEFRHGARLRRWGYLQGDFGPNRFRLRAGALEVEPARSAWRDGARSFFLYRDVTGDFDVRARIRVTGRSPAGLLLRARREGAGDREDWVAVRAVRSFAEAVSTRDGRSRAIARRGHPGWVVLRAVRRGRRVTLYRAAGRSWLRQGAFTRADLPPTLQAGVGAAGTAPGAIARVDWVRFSPVR